MSVLDQWRVLKAQHPSALLMFQLGDFYELFFDDARAASAALSIALTRRGKQDETDIPMCGVPVATADTHIARLCGQGFTVAIAGQVAAAEAGGKGPFDRVILRLVTPGTTLDELAFEPNVARHLIAIRRGTNGFSLAIVDVARLRGETLMCGVGGLIDVLGGFQPVEILCDPSIALGPFEVARSGQILPGPAAVAAADDGDPAELAARLRDYVGLMQSGELAAKIVFDAAQNRELKVDVATREALGLWNGAKTDPLIRLVDRTVTPLGARLLAVRLMRPSCDLDDLRSRQARWAALLADDAARRSVRNLLNGCPDLERAAARVGAGRQAPRDLAGVRSALLLVRSIVAAGHLPEVTLEGLTALVDRLDAVLDDAPNARVRGGCDRALDAARALAEDSRQAIAGLQARLVSTTGVSGLKIRHHAQFGYVAEVTAASVQTLRDQGFVLRQGLANAARLSNPDITALGDAIVAAREDAESREGVILATVAAAIRDALSRLMALADAIAELDVAQSVATLVQEGVWCRPDLSDGLAYQVRALRHPEVARSLGGAAPFIPNDCDLSPGRRLMLLTGPNMAGKSTYLRQNAIAIVLAQAGLAVPAEQASIGLVDAVFSRIGASDDLARGRSTFMMEMMETATILNEATVRSFVILDEVGRGTATQDGLAIAQAVLEALHGSVRCRGIFATHFLELAGVASGLTNVQACAMRVRQGRNRIVFLHEIAEGAASRSWGVHVAGLAGVPSPVVARAAQLLAAAERALPSATLPLFSSVPLDAAAAPAADPVYVALQGYDPDAMTPRDALAALYALKTLARET